MQQVSNQTPQILPGQRTPSGLSMGAQQLFQAHLAQSQGVGQLPAGAQFGAGPDGFNSGMRQDMGPQGVTGAGPSQLGLLGMSQGYPGQEQLLQQQRTQQQ